MRSGHERAMIGHYILGRKIGTGGFGVVREAEHQLTKTQVAIKMINKRKIKNRKLIAKTKREIRFLRYFNHPNVIRLYEVLQNVEDIFIVMELAPKGELYQIIEKEGKMEENKARKLFLQILSGLQYCHQNLVAHRDLKPENILIDNKGILKIVDFGLSNLMKDGKFLRTQCGSPNYAAPQIVGGKSYEGTAVDIWSFGVILYAMLTGYLPFDEEHEMALYRRIQNASYTIPGFISDTAKDLISRMLMLNPADRIRTYQIKNHPWVRSTVPIYAFVSASQTHSVQPIFRPNMKILNIVKGYNLSETDKGDEFLIKSIKKKDDMSFVIAYRLLQDKLQKQKIDVLSKFQAKPQQESRMQIFPETKNQITHPSTPKKQWSYGKTFKTTARQLMKAVITVLQAFNTTVFIKSPNYRIQCVYTFKKLLLRNTSFVQEKEHDQMTMEEHIQEDSQDEETKQAKIPRYTRKEVTFTLQIYRISQNQHLLEIQLNRGHPFLFLEHINKFFVNLNIELSK